MFTTMALLLAKVRFTTMGRVLAALHALLLDYYYTLYHVHYCGTMTHCTMFTMVPVHGVMFALKHSNEDQHHLIFFPCSFPAEQSQEGRLLPTQSEEHAFSG